MKTAGDPYAAVARRLGGRLLGQRPLTGGVSADVRALDIESDGGGIAHVVIRQHMLEGDHAVDPETTAAEFELLTALADAGLPVPRPLHLDTGCTVLPGPYYAMPFIDGTTDVAAAELPAALEQMAAFLARLHGLDAAIAPSTLPTRRDPVPEALKYLPHTPGLAAVRAHLEARRDRPVAPDSAILHGDYWPGNLMWRAGRLVAVIDWEDAAVGDPLADVAGCRVELAWKYGHRASAEFTRLYGAARGAPVDEVAVSHWELFVASAGLAWMSTWGLPPETEARIRASSSHRIAVAARRVLAG